MTREPEHIRDHLLVQLQPWAGPPLPKEGLVLPPLAERGTLALGYLGDMQLRFVFDRPGETLPAAVRPEELERLGLTPGTAARQAVANLRRVCGVPQIGTLGEGVYSLRGAHREYSPGYLLDRAFWRTQLEKFPQGLLAALPRHGVLLFAPAGDPAIEAELVRQAGRMAAAAGSARISGCLYRFEADGWKLHAELPGVRPAEAPADRTRAEEEPSPSRLEEEQGQGVDLDKAALGQKMLIRSVLGSFLLGAAARGGHLLPGVVFGLSMALTVYSLRGVVRLGIGLGKSRGATIACMVASFVPLLNLLAWITLSLQATRRLRDAGWQVGLLGARA